MAESGQEEMDNYFQYIGMVLLETLHFYLYIFIKNPYRGRIGAA